MLPFTGWIQIMMKFCIFKAQPKKVKYYMKSLKLFSRDATISYNKDSNFFFIFQNVILLFNHPVNEIFLPGSDPPYLAPWLAGCRICLAGYRFHRGCRSRWRTPDRWSCRWSRISRGCWKQKGPRWTRGESRNRPKPRRLQDKNIIKCIK